MRYPVIIIFPSVRSVRSRDRKHKRDRRSRSRHGRSHKRYSSSESAPRSRSRHRHRRPPSPVSEDRMVQKVEARMREILQTILGEHTPPPVIPEVAAQPGPSTTVPPLPPLEGGDDLSIYPSGDEGDEDVERAVEPPVLAPVTPLKVIATAVVQPPVPTPKVPGFTGQQVPDEVLFPAQRPASATLMGDTLPALLDTVETEVRHLRWRQPPLPSGNFFQEDHKRLSRKPSGFP